MSEDTSTLRLYALRLLYLLNFVFLGLNVWPLLIRNAGAWDPVKGVAFSFWAALSTLCALGLRYPLRMLPVLLMQLVYKAIWLIAIALPQWPELRSSELTRSMLSGLVGDLVIIPWPYVYAHYVRARGDRWRSRSTREAPSEV